LKDFEIIKKLGEGAFGQVYQVRRKIDQSIYALKKVKMHGLKEKEKDNAINEIRILASLNNDHVIKFK
jgi:NIMA (never in mitosis gene a)-related kinase